MRNLGLILTVLGSLILGLFGVFAIWVVDRHEQELAKTETAQRLSSNPMGNGLPELLQAQRDRLKGAKTIQLGSGVAGGVLFLAGVGLLLRLRKASSHP